MTRFRMGALTALIACVGAFSLAGTASAQDTSVPMTQKVAIAGANKGKDFSGTYAIQRFEKRGGKLFAVGTLKGKLKNRSVTRKDVAIPATLTGAGDGASASQAATCQILKLDLGPLDLNLLGLRVQLNAIHLLITAVQGPNNLLGNLLCALTGILNPSGALGPLTGAINNLASALNAILALVPTNPATGAAAVAGSR
jgi:hypothetical protein